MSKARTALVLGANGISGIALIDELIKAPSSQWSKIIAMSRRPPIFDHADPRITFKSVDLLKEPSVLVQALKDVGGEEVTDVFFYAYVEVSDPKESEKVNGLLLKNTIEACEQVCKKIQVFQLQTGYKYYGTHLGGDQVAPYPWREDAKRHEGPNFYFGQEDLLQEAAKKNSWHWIITRPSFIIGVSKGNFMSIASTLALYAVARKALGQPLVFPGTTASYNRLSDNSTASNNAQFQIFASLTPKAYDKAFNIQDGDPMTFDDLWKKTSEYFDVPLADPPADSPSKPVTSMDSYREILHPTAAWATEVDLNAVAKKLGMDPEVFEYATWKFMDGGLSCSWKQVGSLDAARSVGWDKSIDTWKDGYVVAFERLKAEGVIPK